MKKNSYIINTSKGGILNEKDLIHCLKNNFIKGAAIDVFNNENFYKKNISAFYKNELFLYAKKNKNLIIFPHIAGASKYAILYFQNQMLQILLKKSKKFYK